MAQPGSVMWGKFAIMMVGITIGGWGLMKAVTPTEQQLYDRLSPDLKAKVDAVRAQRAASSDIRDKLQSASSGETDQIVWAEQLGSSKPAKGNRFV